MDVMESVKAILGEVEKLLSSKTVIGEPMTFNGMTIIPLTSVSFGFGGGGGQGTSPKGDNGGGQGSGGGGRVSPTAVIVIKGDDVNVFPIGGKGAIEKILEMIPEVVQKATGENCCSKKGKGRQEAEE
ncbi:MAG: sporulation protein [Firmicutes bacterium]|nr:sporulation protein [Bacillota bacterium]MCL5040047.1 sporulation protein [Bacillota bacterium]